MCVLVIHLIYLLVQRSWNHRDEPWPHGSSHGRTAEDADPCPESCYSLYV